MKIQLHLLRTEYTQGEKIDVDVYVTNTGAEPVTVPLPGEPANWQPVYALTGPGATQPSVFSYRSVRFKTTDHTGAQAVVESLAPGRQFAHGFALNDWQDVSAPGKYTLRAGLEWNGLRTMSEPVAFEVVANTFADAGVAVPQGVPDARDIMITWLGEGAPGAKRTIGRAVYFLKRPDLGELHRQDMRSLRSVSAAAADPLAAATNFDPAMESMLRFGWRDGSKILIAAGLESPAAEADLGTASFRVVQPAVVDRSGRTGVFAFDGRKAWTVVFSPRDSLTLDAKASPVELPLPIETAAAAVAPESSGGRFHVVAAGERGGDLVFMHWTDSGGGVELLDVPGVSAWKSSQPAVHVNPDGTVFAAIVARKNGVGFVPVLVAARFAGTGQAPSKPAVADIPWTGGTVDSAAAAFESASETAGRPTWAIALKDGRIVHARNADGMTLSGAPVRPLRLVLLRSQAFALVMDGKSGPKMVALN